ncbi:MAG: NAD-dependent epimerase/dehydratase family protein, partial [candidate division NC10 bacterium]
MSGEAVSLVTGVAGFIGSHLAERLLREGHRILGVDAFTDYYPRAVKMANLGQLLDEPGFRFVELDVAQAELGALVAEADFIFHQAGQPGVRASWGREFEVYLESNVQ